jgi:hypothetical protein
MQCQTGAAMPGQSGACHAGGVIMELCDNDARYCLFTVDYLFRRCIRPSLAGLNTMNWRWSAPAVVLGQKSRIR